MPKLTADGVTESAACIPDPLSATVAGEFRALFAIARVPDALPVPVGTKVTVKELLALGLILRGNVAPLTLKAAPVTEA